MRGTGGQPSISRARRHTENAVGSHSRVVRKLYKEHLAALGDLERGLAIAARAKERLLANIEVIDREGSYTLREMVATNAALGELQSQGREISVA